ncbi:MAG: PTS sugar transporter subunit IIC, partial [Streptococcus sp.]|nr:PTS sugar transporter subunit IIC [Streptococcus sp.]
GTPSLLYAFIGTGGSLRALAVSLFCFALDVAIFIPFVRLSNKVQHGLKEEGETNEAQ